LIAQTLETQACPMQPHPDPRGSTAEWLTDRALRGMIALLRLLPYRRRVPLMGALMRQVIAPLAGYRRRALANLALIRPDLPPAARRQIADAVCDNFGRTLIENYDRAGFAAQVARSSLSGEGLAALDKARAAGRPVLFVTGHFGNYEAPRQALVARGHAIGSLYRPMRNAFFNRHYVATLDSLSGPNFAQGRKGTMGFARHLKQGGMAVLLFDVWTGSGIALDFLGQPALTSTAAADLALRFDAVVIPYFGTRRADGLTFDIALEAPIAAADPATMLREMTARLTARIIGHPDQWFWVHRRWKTPRPRP